MVAGTARALAALLALLLPLLVRAQGAGAPGAVLSALASPQAAVGTFLRGMNDADVSRAVQALDLSGLGPLERADRGPQLAFKLWAVLNREAYVEVDALPDAADAPPYVQRVTTAGGREVGRLTVAKGPDGAYRYTANTLADLDRIWPAVRGKPVVAGLPDPDPRQMDPAEWMEGRMDADGRRRLLGVAAWRWIALAILLASGVLAYFLIRGLTLLIARRVLRLDESGHAYRDLLQGGLGLSVALVAGLVARDAPLLERGAWGGLLAFVARTGVVLGLVVLAFAVWDAAVRGYVRHAETRAQKTRRLLAPVALRLGRAAIVALALLGVCEALGFRPSSILAALGVGGLAVAFAAKDSIENVFGSIVVLVESPFAIGDWVKVGEASGRVEDIRLRSTRLRTLDDSVVVFPNSALLTKGVENFGLRRYRHLRTTVKVALGTPPDRLREFAESARAYVDAHPGVSDERRSVRLNDFGGDCVELLLDCYLVASDTATELEIREDVLLGILRVAHGMEIPLGG